MNMRPAVGILASAIMVFTMPGFKAAAHATNSGRRPGAGDRCRRGKFQRENFSTVRFPNPCHP
jgi:hypothetical protein